MGQYLLGHIKSALLTDFTEHFLYTIRIELAFHCVFCHVPFHRECLLAPSFSKLTFYPLFLTQVLQFEMGFQPQFGCKSYCTSIICTLYPFRRVVALHVFFDAPRLSRMFFAHSLHVNSDLFFVMFPIMCYESLVHLVFLFTYITICITFLVPWYIIWHLLIHLKRFSS